MAIKYKERSTYERKAEIEGSERIVVDETHYIDPDQIIEKAAETFPSQDDLEAVVERVETIEDSMYEKPSGGIPKSDLSEGVQESLEKADSALQEHQSLAAYRTAEAQDEIDAELSDAISGEQSRAGEAEQQLAARCTEIEGKIPNQATSANQLADKAFVNSSIATNTANYISDDGQPFTSPSALPTTGVTNNDYAFVTGTDEAGNTYYDRYKATVSGSSVTWAKEYRLNNSGFTAAQWAAIGSGITAVLTAKLVALPTNEALTVLLAGKADADDIPTLLSQLQSDSTHRTVTDAEKAAWNNKAEKDGYYSGMAVGIAENLIDTKGEGTSQVFVRRTSAGDASIVDEGRALIKSIKGNAIVWNQKVKNYDFSQWDEGRNLPNDWVNNSYYITSRASVSRLKDRGGIRIVVGGSSSPVNWMGLNCGIRLKKNHRYMVGLKVQNSTTIRIGASGSTASSYNVGIDSGGLRTIFITLNYTGPDNDLCLVSLMQSAAIGSYVNLHWINIIDLSAFGEDWTITYFLNTFGRKGYRLCEGQLLSLNATGITTDGFNQYNGQYVKVFANKEYYINGTFSTLKFATTIDGEQEDITPADHLYTPAADGYIFATGVSADFCINLSWSGYRNGEHEPYWQETRQLPAMPEGGLKSCGSGSSKVYDEITPERDIIRVGSREYQDGDEEDVTLTTDGTTTYYPLDEPVITTYETPRNLTYKVADFGTEQVEPQGVDEQGVPLTAPFRAVIKYPDDYTRQLVNMPKNYQSQESMEALLTAMGDALGFTYTKVWDASNNKWTYTITKTTEE